jgi:DnaB-like helicase N terminal domain/AAA domain
MSVTPLRLDEPPRLPPRNVEAEQALLGALLRDNRAYASVADIVRREDFSLEVHGRIFAVIGNVIAHGTEANSTMLRHIFDGDRALRERGGGAYIGQLAESAVTISNAPDYARVIVDLARRRGCIAALEDGLDDLYAVDGLENATAIDARLRARLDEIGSSAPGRLVGISPDVLDGLPVPARRFIVTPWIPTARATGLYGTPGVGKTTLMQMLCTSTALDPAKFPNANWLGLPVRHCHSVLLFCEDDIDEMHARQEEINRSYGCSFDDLEAMLWLPRLGEDSTLMTFENGRARRTPFFFELLSLTKAHGAQLAVWDTLRTFSAARKSIAARRAGSSRKDPPTWRARSMGA